MNLTEQVAEMIRKDRERFAEPRGSLQQFEQLIAAGLIRRREYDIPPVNVFGSSGRAPESVPTMNHAGRVVNVMNTTRLFP
ncbi:hypothetical protein [Thauera chlorobenzoica]|uniref:hypothetical protein n=1 Tax=Thauera chlorobenzoica TaxID=96773 RepID=UPI0011B0941A|nr:hypothetical protein [Thauera chlorobenzoica]